MSSFALLNKTESNAEEVSKALEYNNNTPSEYLITAPGGSDGIDPDMLITKENSESGLEYKKKFEARMANPTIKIRNRVAVPDGKFIGDPNAEIVCEYINNNNIFDKWMDKFNIDTLDNATGETIIPLLEHYRNGGGTSICDFFDVDNLGELTANYYVKKDCHYMQVGDNFYKLTNNDVFGLHENIPTLKGDGKFKCRFNFDVKNAKRGAGKWNYPKAYNDYMKLSPSFNKQSIEYKRHRADWVLKEGGKMSVRILPELHLKINTVNESNYSLELNTNKINPLI